MAVKVRKVETGVVIGVSEIVAEGLCVSGEFERVEEDPAPAEKPKPKRARRAQAQQSE